MASAPVSAATMARALVKGKARALVAAPLDVTHGLGLTAATTGARRTVHSSSARAGQSPWQLASTSAAGQRVGGAPPEPRDSRSFVTEAATSSVAPGDMAASRVAAVEPAVIESTAEALTLLRSQPLHYVVASIAGRTLLLHARDLVTLPRMNDVQVGDVLELDRIHEVGSRDYTLRAQDPMSTRARGPAALMRRSNYLQQQQQQQQQATGASPPSLPADSAAAAMALAERLPESQSWAARLRPSGLGHVGAVLDASTVRVRCTVVEHTKGRMEFIVKKKRRKGYKKTIQHKQTYTRLRVDGIQLG